MEASDFISLVWNRLPVETKFKIVKIAESKKITLCEVVVSLLSTGVNTLASLRIGNA